ncbi:MAG: hypothetical protein JO192_13595 [Candidatus Eremiobacteraeota bacterium]|nr:hypothetical protein [Candidatus Eremiobacteraeota bacterium]MBV8722736.1 hypothetical protein [Candidatus Eremiobacteraeota bacterium]
MVDGPALEALLCRHGIPRSAPASLEPFAYATIRIDRPERARGTLDVTIDGIRATGPCPLDEAHAVSIAAAFSLRALLPSGSSSAEAFASLLHKMSDAFVESGARRMVFHQVRVYSGDCNVGPVVAEI